MKLRKGAGILLCVLLLLTLFFQNHPQFCGRLFVELYGDRIASDLAAGNGVPAAEELFLGYRYVNTWEGAHPMTEFLLLAIGDTYYGVYYSPDDVPLSFQNVSVDLTQTPDGRWTWEGEGDNHGATSRIRDCWYYFEASF